MSFPGIPYPVVLMIVIAVVASFVLNRTVLGRHIYATGSNGDAAKLSGVNVPRVTAFTYIVSGTLAGLTGCVLMSRLVTAQPNEGVAYELDAIASAVIGGTSLIGGVGTISGTFIGAFVIGILRNGLNMNGVSASHSRSSSASSFSARSGSTRSATASERAGLARKTGRGGAFPRIGPRQDRKT